MRSIVTTITLYGGLRASTLVMQSLYVSSWAGRDHLPNCHRISHILSTYVYDSASAAEHDSNQVKVLTPLQLLQNKQSSWQSLHNCENKTCPTHFAEVLHGVNKVQAVA